jgi:hypothetical protein
MKYKVEQFKSPAAVEKWANEQALEGYRLVSVIPFDGGQHSIVTFIVTMEYKYGE